LHTISSCARPLHELTCQPELSLARRECPSRLRLLLVGIRVPEHGDIPSRKAKSERSGLQRMKQIASFWHWYRAFEKTCVKRRPLCGGCRKLSISRVHKQRLSWPSVVDDIEVLIEICAGVLNILLTIPMRQIRKFFPRQCPV